MNIPQLEAAITHILGLSILISQTAIFLILANLVFSYHKTKNITKAVNENKILNFLALEGPFFSLVIAIVAASGSLFFSEILKLPPCELCWWQRVAVFPQIIILALNLKNNDEKLVNGSLVLSFMGILIAAYHYYVQIGGQSLVNCVVGSAPDCAQKNFVEFGYITIPLMTATALSSIIILLFLNKAHRKQL